MKLQPLPVDLDREPLELSFPPSYGEHTAALLQEAGFTSSEVDQRIEEGIAFASGGGSGV